MKHTSKIMAAAIVVVAILLVVRKVSSDRAAQGGDSGAMPAAPLASNAQRSHPVPPGGVSGQTGENPQAATQPAADSAEVERIRAEALEKIHDASVSYDAAELPVIRPYLLSSDPVLRTAAVDAMIVLGDASAGPMLREAARGLASEEEAKKMIQAADYIELPPANIKEIGEKLRKNREDQQQK